ncbi:hypothetical protein Tcan_00697, partial [Toxocara canis]|uniref:ATS domain-containing protein n=2 Tax=Toxocara canis TaxID=6265 RepID=A0A183UHE2_TOXCA
MGQYKHHMGVFLIFGKLMYLYSINIWTIRIFNKDTWTVWIMYKYEHLDNMDSVQYAHLGNTDSIRYGNDDNMDSVRYRNEDNTDSMRYGNGENTDSVRYGHVYG